MKAVVLDTSAIIRFYLPDGPIPDLLEESIQSAWNGETSLLIPDLALAEVTQVFRKKEKAGYLNVEETDELISLVLDLPLEVIAHYEMIRDALTLARLTDLTVYDALFLALAGKKNALLITADKKLQQAYANRPSYEK